MSLNSINAYVNEMISSNREQSPEHITTYFTLMEQRATVMLQQMQAMIAGRGIKSPYMFDAFDFPKTRKEKQPNAELQSAAEAKRARKAAKNLAAVQKKALAKA